MAKQIMVLTSKTVTGPAAVDFAKVTNGKYLCGFHSGYAKIQYKNVADFNSAKTIAKKMKFSPMTEEEFSVRNAKAMEEEYRMLDRNKFSEEELQGLVTQDNIIGFKNAVHKMTFIFDVLRACGKTGTANCGYRLVNLLNV